MKPIYVLICILITVIAKQSYNKSLYDSHQINKLKPKENFLTRLNKKLYNIMNKIFERTKLSKNVFEESKMKLLLTICRGLENIAKEKLEIYDVLKKVSMADIDNKATKQIGLDKIIRESINDHIFGTNKENKSLEFFKATSINQNSETKLNDINFKELVRGVLNKINNLTVDDFRKNNNSVKSFSFKHKGVDVWEPSKSIETNNILTQNRRIFKGLRTPIESYPFIVSLNVLGLFACAGSIIAKDLILTAASCLQIHYNNRFFRERPKTIFVRVASPWTMRGGEVIPVLELYFHPQYDPKTLKHNLAIARLEKVLQFAYSSKIKRIMLDSFEGNLPSNVNEVLILGWGPKEPFKLSNKFDKLSYSRLKIFPIDECKEVYLQNYVTENNFCAGFFTKGSGACNRDVGGPGVVDGLLVGIVSFGSPACGMPNSPTVFTRVGNYIDWIEGIMEQEPARHRMSLSSPMNTRNIFYYPTIPPTPHLMPIQEETQEDDKRIDKKNENMNIHKRSRNFDYLANDNGSPIKLRNPYLNSNLTDKVKKYDVNYKNLLPDYEEIEPDKVTRGVFDELNEKYLIKDSDSNEDSFGSDEREVKELHIFDDW